MNTDSDATPNHSENAAARAFRRYFLVRILGLVAVLLMIAAVILTFVLKNSPLGWIGSVAAMAVFYTAFQILYRKRRAWFRRWLTLKGGPRA